MIFSLRALFSIYILILHQATFAQMNAPSTIRIGILTPLTSQAGNIDLPGSRRNAAVLMAIKEINNKTDGIYDWLLPNTTIQYTVRDTQRVDALATVLSVDLAVNSFSGKSIAAVIGDVTSSGSVNAQNILNLPLFGIPQISHSSDSTVLSDPIYSLFARTVPAAGLETQILLDFIQSLGYTHINTLAANDLYSSSGINSFLQNAQSTNVTIGSQFQFVTASASSISAACSKMKDLNNFSAVVVWAQLLDLADILFHAYALNMLQNKAWFLSSTGLSLSGVYMYQSVYNVNNITVDEINNNILKGLFISAVNNGVGKPNYQAFLNRWNYQRSFSDTLFVSASGAYKRVNCSKDVDSEGNYLYIRPWGPDKTKTMCVGVDFARTLDIPCSAACNDAKITDKETFAYDSVIALAMGIHNVISSNSSSYFDLNFTSIISRKPIFPNLLNLSFPGASGTVMFNKKGDRASYSAEYFILNFSGVAWQWISTFTSVSSFPCISNPLITFACVSNPVFNTPNNAQPLEPDFNPPTLAPIIVQELFVSSNLKKFIISILALSILHSFGYVLILVKFRNSPVILAASPKLVWIYLFGSIISLSGSLLFVFESNDTISCGVPFFIISIGASVMFSSILLKSYRVVAVFNDSLQSVAIQDSQLMSVVGCAVLYDVVCFVILLLNNSTSPSRTLIILSQTTSTTSCMYPTYWLLLIIVFPKFIALLYGIKLAYVMRSIPDLFNETTILSYIIYNISFETVILVPILFVTNDINAVFLLKNLIVIWGVVFSIGCFFLSKIHFIRNYSSKIVDDSYTNNKTNKTKRTGDSTPGSVNDEKGTDYAYQLALSQTETSKVNKENQDLKVVISKLEMALRDEKYKNNPEYLKLTSDAEKIEFDLNKKIEIRKANRNTTKSVP